MKNIVIIGAGDLGKEVVWLIEDINKITPTYLILGFLDDDPKKNGTDFYGYKVLGGTEKLTELGGKMPLNAVVAIQDGHVRKRLVEAHPEFDCWETIVHPTAVIASSCSVGKGNIIFPQVTFSVDTKIGDFGLYYIHASIGNDCVIGDYVSVMLNSVVGEHAELSELCRVDSGAKVEPHTSLGVGSGIPPKPNTERKELSKIVLIGAGGFGREVAVIIEDINRFSRPTYEILGFLDDGEKFGEGDQINGYPWLGKHEWALAHTDGVCYVCAVADVHIRAQLQKKLMAQGVRFATVCAVGAYVAQTACLGSGCVLYTGVMVSANAKLGDGVLLNTYTNVGHDVTIGDYTSVAPAVCISGGCKIGSEVNFGGHAYLVPGRTVGDGAMIAAGSVVFNNVKEHTTVLGNPAKRMKALEA